jgi:hypothetical protein
MSSPITKWDGATTYFTFADNPTVMGVFLLLAIVATIGAVVAGSMHETESYAKIKE